MDSKTKKFLNLLSNAVKFTPEEGRIDVYQEESPAGSEYVRTHFCSGIRIQLKRKSPADSVLKHPARLAAG